MRCVCACRHKCSCGFCVRLCVCVYVLSLHFVIASLAQSIHDLTASFLRVQVCSDLLAALIFQTAAPATAARPQSVLSSSTASSVRSSSFGVAVVRCRKAVTRHKHSEKRGTREQTSQPPLPPSAQCGRPVNFLRSPARSRANNKNTHSQRAELSSVCSSALALARGGKPPSA